MSHQSGKKTSAPIAIILPILIALIIIFQNAQQDQSNKSSTTTEQNEVNSIDPSNDVSSANNKNFLKQLDEETFESPAGLVYSNGSVDGHRLDHLMRHTQDIPDKPVHGVFDGDKENILRLLDEVWNLSQERGPPQVEVRQERGRTVITADVGREIGYTGGQSGKRKGYPKCSRVRLVVDGQDVITAYPVL